MSVLDIFLQIVKIESESGYELEQSKWIASFLKQRGVEYVVDPYNQIYARIKTPEAEESILYAAHLDTVSPGKLIIPKIEDGIITSSGDTILGADNKATVASMLQLIEDVTSGKIDPKHNLEFCFTTSEELYPNNSKKLDFDWFNSKVCFIFDVANRKSFNQVVTEACYLNEFKIEFIGKGAHASRPDIAKNALSMLNLFLNNIKVGAPYPGSTLCIGIAKGGESSNAIMENFTIEGDYRSFEKETIAKIQKDINVACEKVLSSEEFKDCRINIEDNVYCSGYKHDINKDSFKRLKNIYKSLGYSDLEAFSTQSASDANVFNNNSQITAYCLNDGTFNSHTTKEYVSLENLNKLYQIIQKISTNY